MEITLLTDRWYLEVRPKDHDSRHDDPRKSILANPICRAAARAKRRPRTPAAARASKTRGSALGLQARRNSTVTTNPAMEENTSVNA